MAKYKATGKPYKILDEGKIEVATIDELRDLVYTNYQSYEIPFWQLVKEFKPKSCLREACQHYYRPRKVAGRKGYGGSVLADVTFREKSKLLILSPIYELDDVMRRYRVVEFYSMKPTAKRPGGQQIGAVFGMFHDMVAETIKEDGTWPEWPHLFYEFVGFAYPDENEETEYDGIISIATGT
jgi:hypothetical protein